MGDKHKLLSDRWFEQPIRYIYNVLQCLTNRNIVNLLGLRKSQQNEMHSLILVVILVIIRDNP